MARPTAKSKVEKDTIEIKIANTKIRIGQSYEVIPKKDPDAPDGMQAKGTTKFLHEGNRENRAIDFDESRRAWNTGFYEQSRCLQNMLKEDEAELVKYIKYIKEPYEKLYNVSCSETNNEFWDSYRYPLYTGQTFNTSDPKQLFDLFHALTKARICNPNEKDPELRKASYCIKNTEVEKTLEEERLEDKANAISKFMVLLETDKEKLYAVLEWIQMSDVRSVEDKVLRPTILRSFDNPATGYDFSRRFLEGLDMYDTEEGKQKMEYFIMCQKLLLKNKIERKNNSLFLNGKLLGNTVHEVAQKALNKEDISKMLKQEYTNTFENK